MRVLSAPPRWHRTAVRSCNDTTTPTCGVMFPRTTQLMVTSRPLGRLGRVSLMAALAALAGVVVGYALAERRNRHHAAPPTTVELEPRPRPEPRKNPSG